MAHRLRLRPDIRCSLRECQGSLFYLLEDPLQGKFYRIGLREWQLAKQLDGTRTLHEIIQSHCQGDAGALSPSEAAALCQWLVACELVDAIASGAENKPATPDRAARGRPSLTNLIFLRITLVNPDRFLQRCLPYLRWTIGWTTFWIWLLALCVGIFHLAVHWDRFRRPWEQIFAPQNWIALLLVWIGLKVIHEFFHGLVCKRYGGSVPRAGILLILFSPVAFVDVTSSWRFASKWQRMHTAAAGMYAELFVASIAAIAWSHSPAGWWEQVCHNTVFMASVTAVLFNANFLIRFDGYYLVSDWLEIQNLYTSGVQYLRYLVKRYLLGVPAPAPCWSGKRSRVIKIYAFASLFWRILFYVGIVFVASRLFHGAGLVLSAAAVCAWFLLPMMRFVHYVLRGTAQEKPKRVRFAVILAGAAFTAVLAIQLPWPGGVSAPAVVDYEPLHVVRVISPGFVRKIAVRPSQWVDQDTVVAELDNPETQQQLHQLELEIQQCHVRARIRYQEDDLAGFQVHQQQARSLEQRCDELRQKVDNLTLRAPCAGHVIGRDLEVLVGQYLNTGDPLMAIGNHNQKVLKASVAQQDVELFVKRIGSCPRVRIKGWGTVVRGARLIKVDPRASSHIPHPALAATAGGPLVVTQRRDEDRRQEAQLSLVEPRFVATLRLPQEDSSQWLAGQLARIRIPSSGQSIGQHLDWLFRRWMRRKLHEP